jgi:hypothetical protein
MFWVGFCSALVDCLQSFLEPFVLGGADRLKVVDVSFHNTFESLLVKNLASGSGICVLSGWVFVFSCHSFWYVAI